MSKNQKLLDIIATCDDEKKLRNWISNANREGAEEVADLLARSTGIERGQPDQQVEIAVVVGEIGHVGVGGLVAAAVELKVVTPKNLDDRQAELLHELAESFGLERVGANSRSGHGIFDRVKDAFRGEEDNS